MAPYRNFSVLLFGLLHCIADALHSCIAVFVKSWGKLAIFCNHFFTNFSEKENNTILFHNITNEKVVARYRNPFKTLASKPGRLVTSVKVATVFLLSRVMTTLLILQSIQWECYYTAPAANNMLQCMHLGN